MASEDPVVVQDLVLESEKVATAGSVNAAEDGKEIRVTQKDTSKLMVSVEPSPQSDDVSPLDIIESRIRGVLNTRPSIRMAKKSRPLHLVDKPLSRNDATRHTMPSRVQKRAVASDQPDASLRINQLRKPSIPASFSLNEGLSGFQRNNSTDLLVSTEAEKETAFSNAIENEGANEVPLVIVVQDGNNQTEEDEEEVSPSCTLERFGELRKSTMYLKHRIQKQ